MSCGCIRKVKQRTALELSRMDEGLLDVRLGVVRLSQAPSVLAFAPFSSSLAVCTRDSFNVITDKEISSSWTNGNTRVSQITRLYFVVFWYLNRFFFIAYSLSIVMKQVCLWLVQTMDA